jgi:hypothetical protein
MRLLSELMPFVFLKKWEVRRRDGVGAWDQRGCLDLLQGWGRHGAHCTLVGGMRYLLLLASTSVASFAWRPNPSLPSLPGFLMPFCYFPCSERPSLMTRMCLFSITAITNYHKLVT